MNATISPQPKGRRPRTSRGDTILLAEILLFAGVVTLGVALWALSLGYVSSQGTQMSREYDRMISQHRILLVIEAASLQSNIVWVSNPGMNDVIVLSCTIYPKTQPSPGIRYNIEPTVVAASPERLETIQGCERYPGEPPYIVELWYMPAHLYNRTDPARNVMSAQVARYEAR